MAKEILRLDTLRALSAGDLEIVGKVHAVRQITLGLTQRIRAAEGTEDFVTVLADCVKRLVPTLSDEEIADLNIRESQAIIMFASAGLAAVERMFPNAASPETPISPG